MLVGQLSRQLSASMEPLSAKVVRITKELGLPESLSVAEAIEQANEQLGLEHAAGTSLVQQANAILAELGLEASPAVPVVVGAAAATGKVSDSPPERSSGTGAPPPTEGRMPAVPMHYRESTKRVLTKRNVWVCWWNVAVVVLSLVTLWFGVLVEHDVLTGSLLPTPSPPPPPAPPLAPTTCPFDVAACNRECALMHVDCKESNSKKKKKRQQVDCDHLHGEETAKGSTAAFSNFTDRRAHLESLDWEHEPLLWGLRKQKIGDGTCDRSGCAATLCECNYDGGDCAEGADPYPLLGYLGLSIIFSIFIYLGTMRTLLKDVIGPHLKAPKLRDEGKLTAYVTKMQREQLQVSLSVVCSHVERRGGGRSKTSHTGTGSSKEVTVVTHRSSHPFPYVTSTDTSTLTRNWQEPAEGGGRADGSLGTSTTASFVAVVSSGLSWSAAKGVTANKLKAEKKRLHAENMHRDTHCSVSLKVSLPGRVKTQLYTPAGAKFTKRLPLVAELLLVFLGLGAPLYFYYARRLSRHVEHRVRKTIYIEGHAPPAGGDGGGAADVKRHEV